MTIQNKIVSFCWIPVNLNGYILFYCHAAIRSVRKACDVVTYCVFNVSSKYDSCESLVCRSASCLLTDESISRTTSSSWPCGQCKDAVRSLIWFSAATSSARFSISFSIRRKFSSLAEKTWRDNDVHYRSVASKTALILLELNYLTCLNNIIY